MPPFTTMNLPQCRNYSRYASTSQGLCPMTHKITESKIHLYLFLKILRLFMELKSEHGFK